MFNVVIPTPLPRVRATHGVFRQRKPMPGQIGPNAVGERALGYSVHVRFPGQALAPSLWVHTGIDYLQDRDAAGPWRTLRGL